MSKYTQNDSLIAVSLFLVTFVVFWLSPIRQVTDSNYSMLLSESLLHHRSFTLDTYAIPRLMPRWHDNNFKNGEMYQIELIGPHLYYYLPPGSSVLSLPYVAWMNVFGVSASNPDGTYSPEGETRIETGLATLLMATLVSILFFTARLVLPVAWSIAVALGAAFGTQIWSTASRALWSDTWAIFLLGVSLYLLLSDAVGWRRMSVTLLATLLAWSYFVRPTNAISVIAVSVYIFLARREYFGRFVLTGLIWLVLFLVYSWTQFHQMLPNYFRPGRLNFGSFGTAFAGNLISPSRGLLIFVPVLLFFVYLLIRYRKTLPYRGLVLLALPVIVVHLIVIAGFTPWNGGFCYGPRYTTGLVPWVALLSILGVRGLLNTQRSVTPRGTIASGVLLIALSIFMNARGATSYETWMWNVWPDNVDVVPQKIWDWRRPQFLAGLVAPPLPDPLPLMRGQIQFGTPQADVFAWYGWSQGEQRFRWSDGHKAAIAFGVEAPLDASLIIWLGPYVLKDKLEQQHVAISLNGTLLRNLTLTDEPVREYVFPIDRTLLGVQNKLVFALPDAASPKSLGASTDQRRLAIRIESIELVPAQIETR